MDEKNYTSLLDRQEDESESTVANSGPDFEGSDEIYEKAESDVLGACEEAGETISSGEDLDETVLTEEEKLDLVLDGIAGLNEKFEQKIARDEHKDRLLDNMHAELTDYHNGTAEKPVIAIAMDVIQLNDSLKDSINRYSDAEPTEGNYAKVIRILEGISVDLEDLLYRQGIEAYSVEGDQVDVRRQKTIGSIETWEETLHNTVAERTACGYEKDGKVIRPERIKIFKYITESEERK